MIKIKRFTLLPHTGDRDKWPLKSGLIADGVPTSTRLPGYEIISQFEIDPGYLLVTDYDCPFEETVNFVLLNRKLQLLSRRSIGAMFSFVPSGATYILDKIVWEDNRHFVATFHGDSGAWRFSIRRFSLPFLFPRLAMTRL